MSPFFPLATTPAPPSLPLETCVLTGDLLTGDLRAAAIAAIAAAVGGGGTGGGAGDAGEEVGDGRMGAKEDDKVGDANTGSWVGVVTEKAE